MFHSDCRALFANYRGTLVVPALTIGEVAYLISKRLGPRAETLFIGDLATGTFSVDAPQPSDWLRVGELVARYHDFPLGTVDASVVVTAERRGTRKIATLDRRHFSVVGSFELLP